MSEYKTLDQWFEGKDRGDGRKFTTEAWDDTYWFEPFFKVLSGYWYGRAENAVARQFTGSSDTLWREWHPPKTKKKVTLYRAILKSKISEIYWTEYRWFSNKEEVSNVDFFTWLIVGWQEMEVFVDE